MRDADQHQREFIAAETCGGVHLADLAAQNAADLAQHFIALGVALADRSLA